MTDLFTFAEAQARAAKSAGMAQVEQNANAKWSSYMLEQVRLTALEMSRFTADDVFDRVEADPNAPVTHDLRAFGPVMKRAASEKYCAQADCRPMPSRRKSLHASPRAVWLSLIWRK